MKYFILLLCFLSAFISAKIQKTTTAIIERDIQEKSDAVYLLCKNEHGIEQAGKGNSSFKNNYFNQYRFMALDPDVGFYDWWWLNYSDTENGQIKDWWIESWKKEGIWQLFGEDDLDIDETSFYFKNKFGKVQMRLDRTTLRLHLWSREYEENNRLLLPNHLTQRKNMDDYWVERYERDNSFLCERATYDVIIGLIEGLRKIQYDYENPSYEEDPELIEEAVKKRKL